MQIHLVRGVRDLVTIHKENNDAGLLRLASLNKLLKEKYNLSNEISWIEIPINS